MSARLSEEEWEPAPGEELGGGSGEVAWAVDFAREIAAEWRTRIVARLDGGRTVNGDGTPNPGGKLLWTMYAKEDR